MEVEKETKLILGCIRYLVEENFFKNKKSPVSSSVVSLPSLPPLPHTPKVVVASVLEEGGVGGGKV